MTIFAQEEDSLPDDAFLKQEQEGGKCLITQTDIGYSEEIIENMSAADIRELYGDTLLLWICGSGCGTGHPAGSYYCVLDYKGSTKFMEGEVYGASTNAAMIEGFHQAAASIKKPIHIHLLTPCPLGFGNSFRGKGPNAEKLQAALAVVKEKDCTLTTSVVTGEVIKQFVMEQGGKTQEPRENKYKKIIYNECIGKVCRLLRENKVDSAIILQVEAITADD